MDCQTGYGWYFLLRDYYSQHQSLSHVRVFLTPWTVAHQAALFMEFSRQEYWIELQFPSPEYLPTQVSSLGLLLCRQILSHLSHQGSPTLEEVPNVLVKPTGSFILLTSYKLLTCSADRLIFKTTEKIMQGRISLDFFLTHKQNCPVI